MKNKEFNKKIFYIKKILLEWLLIGVIGIIIYFIIKDSINHNINFTIVLPIIVVLILYKSKLRYDSFMEYSDSMDLIRKKSSDKIDLNRVLLNSKQAIDIQTQKLKSLKLFSPIPIIIFSIEYFTKIISINFNNLFSKITNLNLSFNTNEWLAIGLFIATIYYIHLYIIISERRKNSILIYYESKIKLDELSFKQKSI